jgi:hypothetical protein
MLNGIIDPKEFNMPKVLLINKSDLINVLSRIYTAEHKYLEDNRAQNNIIMPD